MGITQQPESELTDGDSEVESVNRRPVSRTRTLVMFAISMVLLGGAGYFVYQATDGLDGVWESVSSSPWWMIVLIVLGPMGNHLSVSMCLHALQSRHGKVGVREMFVLVGSAWLFNYLPMRAGLFGRIGYHKAINKIRLRDSIESSIWSGVLAGISNIVLVGIAFLMAEGSGGTEGWLIGLPAVPVVVMFAASALMSGRKTRLMLRALAYRQIDVIVWLGRYWLAFQVLGLEMTISDIAIISAVSQLASLMPLTGSGIGFREWGVGLTASAGGHAMGTAIAGDLINRAAETAIVLPVGLICTAIVARHWNGMNKKASSEALSEDDAGTGSEHEDQSRDAGEQDPAVG